MPLPFLFALSASTGGCQVIDRDYILVGDVAAVVPGFAQLPEDFNLGYAPSSGAPRFLKGIDLQRIAKNRGIDLDGLPDVCFQRRTFVPTAAQIREAMGAALGIADAKIEVSSWSRRPVPAGELVFPLEGVQYSAAQKEQVWHGHVRYAEDRSFPVWAKVRVTANLTRVVALANIPAGEPIRENQLRLESCEDSPLDETAARKLEEVIGLAAKTPLRPMTAIRKTQLERLPDVRRGDLVRVRVFEGAAHLELEGRAQSAGVSGSTILVRNLSSGRDFQAEVTGKDAVTVISTRAGGGRLQ